jgi:hypothetical protein
MRRTLTFVSVFALMISMLALPATADDIESLQAPTVETLYTGQGFKVDGELETVKCGPDTDLGQDKDFVVGADGGYLKWILTANDATEAKLIGPWGTFDMIQAGGGAFHKATNYYPLATLLAYPVKAVHNGTGNVQLTVSNGCSEITLQGAVTIEKTAVPSFTRTHKWDIAKSVTTEKGFKLDEVPKIWLYTDGSGNEKATWKVDVDYKGYLDSAWNVSGTVKISNTGGLPATVTSVLDQMETYDFKNAPPRTVTQYNPVTLNCGVTFPHQLAVGATLECTYSQNVTFNQDAVNPSGINKPAAFGYFGTDMTKKFNESTGPVAFAFTTPTTETNKTVNVEDISDLFGKKDLGSVTAPTGDSFTYDEDFAWADYGQDGCGSEKYDNTATIVETGQSADATLKVNIQCYEFDSAWAKGAGPGATAKPFCDNGFSNWGWTNELSAYRIGQMPLYAGAGQCDVDKGTLVGRFFYTYANGVFNYTFVPTPDSGILFEGEAVYADTGMYPVLRTGRPTTAPGQYYVKSPIPAPSIHVIAHVNAAIPDPTFGPQD